MLTTLLSAFLKDVVTVAQTEAFFDLSPSERKKRWVAQVGKTYSAALQQYLMAVKAEDFVKDVRLLLPVVTDGRGVLGHLLDASQGSSDERLPLQLPPSLASSKGAQEKLQPSAVDLSEEFVSDIQALLHELTQDQDAERYDNRLVASFAASLAAEVADEFDRDEPEIGGQKTHATEFLQRVFSTGRTSEMGYEIQRFLADYCKIDSPILQSPYAFSSEEKQQAREFLRKRYPGSFPLFEVEPSLGGGLRLFYQGALLDESWATQIDHLFTHLHAQRASTH